MRPRGRGERTGETGVALLTAMIVAKKRVENFMVGGGFCLCVGELKEEQI
jgi:hypothetical protein